MNKLFFNKNYVTSVYHFLDGCISEDYGSTTHDHINKLKKSNLFNDFLKMVYVISSNGHNLQDKEQLKTYVTETIDYVITNIHSSNLYLVLSLSQHQICIYLSKKNESEYILTVINSGDGLNNHKKYIDNKLYSLYKSHSLSSTEFSDMIGFIVYSVYCDTINPEYPYDKDEFEVSEKLYTMYKMVYNSYQQNMNGLSLLYNKLNTYQEIDNVNGIFLHNNKHINEFIKKWDSTKIHFNNININNPQDPLRYKANFFNKNTFVFDDKNLYTNPQLSGSCGWYSIFWSIVSYIIPNELYPVNILMTLDEFLYNDIRYYFTSNTPIIDTSCQRINIIKMLQHKKILPTSSSTYNHNKVRMHNLSIPCKINILNESNGSLVTATQSKQKIKQSYNDIIEHLYSLVKNITDENVFALTNTIKGTLDLCSTNLKLILLRKHRYPEYKYLIFLLQVNLDIICIMYFMNIKKNINMGALYADAKSNNKSHINYECKLLMFIPNISTNYTKCIMNEFKSIYNDQLYYSIFEKVIKQKLDYTIDLKNDNFLMERYNPQTTLFINKDDDIYDVSYYTNYKNRTDNDYYNQFKNIYYLGKYHNESDRKKLVCKCLRGLIRTQAARKVIAKSMTFLSYLRPDVVFIHVMEHQINSLTENYTVVDFSKIDNVLTELFSLYEDDADVIVHFNKYNFSPNKISNVSALKNIGHNVYTYNDVVYNLSSIQILTEETLSSLDNENKTVNYEIVSYSDQNSSSVLEIVRDINNTADQLKIISVLKYYGLFNEATIVLYSESGSTFKLLLVNLIESDYTNSTSSKSLIFELTINKQTNIITNVKLNNSDIMLDATIEKYPFMVFAPISCKTYCVKDGTQYKLIMLTTEGDIEKESIIGDPSKPMILELSIKNNLLFPILTSTKKSILTEFYEYYGANKEVCNYFNIKQMDNGFMWKAYKSTPTDANDVDIYLTKISKFSIVNKKIVDNNEFDVKRLNCKFNTINSHDNCDMVILNNLIKDLRNNTVIPDNKYINEHEIDFVKKYPVCNFKCDNVTNIILQIDEIIKLAQTNIYEIAQMIEWKSNIMDSLYSELPFFSYILQTNILLIKMTNLKNVLSLCSNNPTCQEIAEITQYLTMENSDIFSENIYTSFELMFGGLFSKEQIRNFKNMTDSYKKNEKKVYHMMMGKGKSSVISPLLALFLHKQGHDVNLVLPEHLINQAKDTFIDIKIYYGINVNIISDSDAKMALLQNSVSNNSVYIYDEFDTLFDPTKSNFNLVMSGNDAFNNELFEHVFMTTLKLYHENGIFSKEFNDYNIDTNAKWYPDIHNTINEIKAGKLVKNINYGMSKSTDKRVVIPYMRKDSPIEGSSFSSSIITLVLTIVYFDNFELYKEDSMMLIANRDNIVFTLDDNFKYNFSQQTYNTYVQFMKIYKSLQINQKINMLRKYIKYYLLNEIKNATNIYNCSFLDLMNQKVQWQIGYTGTANIKIPPTQKISTSTEGFSQLIQPDYDEKLGVEYALTGEYPNSKNTMYNLINTPESIFEFLNQSEKQYDAFIDAAAIFKYMKNIDVIKKVAMIPQYKNKTFVFLDDNDTKLEYDALNDEVIPFVSKIINNPFYFYSQKNTVGIDFPQKIKMTGLVTIKSTNYYSEIAQAIYRLRKLNRGHIVDILYSEEITGTSEKSNKRILYEQIITNEHLIIDSKAPLLKFQNLKYHLRMFKPDQMQRYNQKYYEQDKMQYHEVKDDSREHLIQIFKNSMNVTETQFGDGLTQTLLNEFLESNNATLIKLLFSTNSIQKNQQIENNKNKELNANVELNTEMESSVQKFDNMFLFMKSITTFILPGNTELLKFQLDNFMFKIISDEKYDIYASYDIFGDYQYEPEHEYYAFLGKYPYKQNVDDPDIYVLIPLKRLHFYYDKFIIYDNTGERINNIFSSHEPQNIYISPLGQILCGNRAQITPNITEQLTKILLDDRKIQVVFIRMLISNKKKSYGIDSQLIETTRQKNLFYKNIEYFDEYKTFRTQVVMNFWYFVKLLKNSPRNNLSVSGIPVEDTTCDTDNIILNGYMGNDPVTLEPNPKPEFVYIPLKYKLLHISKMKKAVKSMSNMIGGFSQNNVSHDAYYMKYMKYKLKYIKKKNQAQM